jgi:hypothetical protein
VCVFLGKLQKRQQRIKKGIYCRGTQMRCVVCVYNFFIIEIAAVEWGEFFFFSNSLKKEFFFTLI